MIESIKIGASLCVPKTEIKMYEEFKGSSAGRRYKEAKKNGSLVDACYGKKTNVIVTLKDGTIISTNSSLSVIDKRFNASSGKEEIK